MIGMAIDGAHAAGIPIGICGQAPSDYPEFADFLVQQGIDSISLNPDSFLRTAESVARIEAGRPQPDSARASTASTSASEVAVKSR